MKSFFKEIFIYHHHFNQNLGEQITAQIGQVSERTLFLFSPLILAPVVTDYIFYKRVQEETSDGSERENE